MAVAATETAAAADVVMVAVASVADAVAVAVDETAVVAAADVASTMIVVGSAVAVAVDETEEVAMAEVAMAGGRGTVIETDGTDADLDQETAVVVIIARAIATEGATIAAVAEVDPTASTAQRAVEEAAVRHRARTSSVATSRWQRRRGRRRLAVVRPHRER